MDHDYSLLAAKRLSEAVKDFWAANVAELRKLDALVAEPLRNFWQTDLRQFKEIRRQLDQTQRIFDQLQMRYSGQAKTKEPSSLREDAFQLHESRRAYLKASMDYSTSAANLKNTLDKLLVKLSSEQSQSMRASREGSNVLFSRWASELERIRSWSKEIELGEKGFRQEILVARKQIEEAAEQAVRPSRELEDYAQSATASLASRGPSTFAALKPNMSAGGKQGWLNAKVVTGKPARTAWVRRWFYVKNGVFGWLVQGTKSGGVEESDRIGVLLCGLRPALSEERRFCFEVKTKDATIVLQADSHGDLTEWMAAFDIAKQKALEDPASLTHLPPGPPAKQTLDLAFAISPPSAPEFAANPGDPTVAGEDSHDRSISLSLGIPNDAYSLGHRGSFDVSSGRRSTAIEGDYSRDQAGKMLQKLDLRKPTGGTQSTVQSSNSSTPATSSAAGGIASLITASHMTLPLAPSAISQSQSLESSYRSSSLSARSNSSIILKSLPASTLAPPTLVHPPNATNLSALAVIVHSETGVGVGQLDDTGGTPSGPLANLWGSFNWGYDNRLERRESSRSRAHDVTNWPKSDAGPNVDADQSDAPEKAGSRIGPSHRKTISLDGDMSDVQRAVIAPPEFPNYYPTILKHHDAQFHLLFPSARREDKLVLVFRATWNPNEQQEFPGRVFVTSNHIYFYSHHVGLVLTTGLSLQSVAEVTAASGRESDFLFLHLKEAEKTDYTRITIKTILEPLKLLQRRMKFLVQNANSSEPQTLEGVVKTMLKLENPDDEDERSPSVESWDDSPHSTPGFPREISQRSGKDLRTRVLIDQDLQGFKRGTEKDVPRFKLPSKPVNYVPMGMQTAVIEKEFDVSPKALFHLLFGDRSAVWQLLYHERQAQNIRQRPWMQQDQNYLRREFEYSIDYFDSIGSARRADVVDIQTIDVNSDHLCYVVTDRKTPWHLPYSQSYTLLTKIVITHVAKSRCRLALYTKVDWSRKPWFIGTVVERKALADLEFDALDLLDVVSEQVRRLGVQNSTKKATYIFGSIGQGTQTIEFKKADPTDLSRMRNRTRQESVLHLIVNHLGSSVRILVASVLTYLVLLARWIWKILNANAVVFSLLLLSIFGNVLLSSQTSTAWWQDRRAGQYMKSLGVGKDLEMIKSIPLADLDMAMLPHRDFDTRLDTQWYVVENALANTMLSVGAD